MKPSSKQITLPPSLYQLFVVQMEVGQFCYCHSSTLLVDEEGLCWLNNISFGYPKESLNNSMRVERREDGFYCTVRDGTYFTTTKLKEGHIAEPVSGIEVVKYE